MRKIAFLILSLIAHFAASTQSTRAFYGAYKFEDGKTAVIAPFEKGLALFWSDGRVAGLKPDGAELLIGKTLGNTTEQDGKITFTPGGGKPGIVLTGREGQISQGVKLALSEKEMTFKNGKQTLAGELILPEGPGPFPVVVQTHGSGEETREQSRGLAYLFASQGIASFIYDKRGCGASDGKDWQASFKDYAKDLSACVKGLKSLPDINPAKVGLYGHSQGGWVVPLTYSMQPEAVAFCILSAANAVTPVEQHLNAGDEFYRIGGNDEQTIREIHDFRIIKYEAGILGKHKKEYKSKFLPEAEQKPWFRLTGGGLPGGVFWKKNGYYDSTPALQRLNCPVLALYAEYDISTDSKTQLPLMQQSIPASQATFKLFPNANHMMMQVAGKNTVEKQLPDITRLADGYAELLTGWVLEIAKR